jgi:hypothetical protein
MFVANGDDFPILYPHVERRDREKKGGVRGACFLQTCRSSGATILSQEITELSREKHKGRGGKIPLPFGEILQGRGEQDPLSPLGRGLG